MNNYRKTLNSILFYFLFISFLSAAQIDTISIPSPSMGKSFDALLVLPESHGKTAERYPVLYLLHGHSGHFTGWYDISGQLKQWADQYKMIIVCPDGDRDSWYVDSPVQKNRKFETFISDELIRHIDSNYKTIANSISRGISGVSMGGYGALYLALKYPSIFGIVGSSSGVLDLFPFSGFWNLQTIFGELPKNKEVWKKYNCYSLLDKIQSTNQKIWIDCGTEDFLIEINRKFHQKLLDKKIEHIYLEKPGSHNIKYWKDSYSKQILFISKGFRGE
jgi:S-formylglutathione hydrolase FrmB